MYAKPTSPQSIGQVLDSSFRLTAASFRYTWILALLAGLVSYASAIYQFAGRGERSLQEAFLGEQDAIYWTLYCLGIIGSMLFTAAMYIRTDQVASGQSEGPGAVGAALGRLPLLIVLTIALIAAIMIGSVLLIIPGIILMVSLVTSVAVFLLEGKGPIASLTSSHRLVWGNWWRTFAILLVAFLIMIVMYFVVGFVVAAIVPFLSGDNAVLGTLLATALVLVLMGILVAPFFVSLILNIYWDLKLRREGGDLAARVQG